MANVSSSNSQEVRVPKLRFRDQNGNEYPPYQHETVGTLFSHISQRNTNMSNSNVITNSAEYGLIPQREFFDKDIAVEGNTDKYYIIEQGDFVYNPRKSTTAPYGPFNCYQGKEAGIVSPLYTCLKPLHSEYTDYLLWYFRTSAWHSYIYHNGAQGGARHDRVGMTNELMDGIPVNLPCQTEQTKVSRFFSLVEERIKKQRQLVEALKSYKRGALSKLFPKKGETTPEYRFAGFTEPWEQRKLIDVCDYVDYRGKTPTKTDSGVFLVTAKNVKDGYIDYEISQEYISKNDYAEVMHRGKPEIGDVLITTEAPCGNVAQVNRADIALAQRIIKYRGHNNVIDNTYLKHYLLSPGFKSILNEKSSGGTVQGIKGSILHQQEIKYPKYEEQTKIGQLLDKLDHLITLHQRKLSEFENVKSGLLQQLFI